MEPQVDNRESKAYEIYKDRVGGTPMLEFGLMRSETQDAWIAIDNHYVELFKKFHKDILSICMNNFRNLK